MGSTTRRGARDVRGDLVRGFAGVSVRKFLSCIVAAAMAVSMCPGIASAAEGEVKYEDFIVDGPTAQFKSDVYIKGVEHVFAVLDPLSAMYEEEYAANSPVEVWVQSSEGNDAQLVASWKMAEAAYKDDGAGNAAIPDYEAAHKAAVPVRSDGDKSSYDAEIGAISFMHYPKADNLDPGKTYWYWLDVAEDAAGGRTASQSVDKPFVVIRESGYRVGPFYDVAEPHGDSWTWMVVGGPTATIDGNSVETGVNGSIYRGASLSSDVIGKTSDAYLALQASAMEGKMGLAGAWQVALRGVDEGHDAYKEDILVTLNAASLEGFDGDAASDYRLLVLDASGDWKVVALADGNEAQGLGITDVRISADGISFKLKGTGKTGVIGTFALAKMLTDEEAGKAFTVTAKASAGGQVTPAGGTYQYGSCPEFIFDAYPGYQLDKVSLVIGAGDGGEGGADAGSTGGTSFTIPNKSSAEVAPYGRYEGNSYTFPESFNSDGKTPNVTLDVTFREADHFTPPADDPDAKPFIRLTAGVPKPIAGDVAYGSVYVGAMNPYTLVAAGATREFKAGEAYGDFSPVTDGPVTLYFDPADGCRAESVTINGDVFKVSGSSYTIPALNANMDIMVNFGFSMGEPTEYFTVRAEYDSSQARVGFGQSGTEWVSSARVARGEQAVLVIEPKEGFALESATIGYGDGSPETDATSWVTSSLTLVVPNIQRDTVARFTFKEKAKSVTVNIPASVEHGKLSPTGAQAVTPTSNLTLTVTADEGYELDLESFGLKGADGKVHKLTPVSTKKNADGTTSYVFVIDYNDAVAAGDGAALSVTFKEGGEPGPVPDGKPIGPGQIVTVQPSDGDDPYRFESGDDHEVLDKVIVDGITIFDDGKEIKDDPDAMREAGLEYDPETGRYTFIDKETGERGDSFTFDPVTGNIVFHSPKDEHVISAEFAHVKDMDIRVEINMSAGSDTQGGGTVIPSGQFQWKQEKDLPLVIMPDEDSEIAFLAVDGKPVDIEGLKDATAADIKAANEIQTSNARRAMGRGMLRTFALDPSASGLSAFAASGNKLHTITSDYLTKKKGDNVEVKVRFALKDAADKTYVITAKAEGPGGTISGTDDASDTLTVSVKAGADYAINYETKPGYKVAYVTDNGTRLTSGFSDASYKLTGIDRDHDVVVTFTADSSSGPLGSVTPASRALRRIQSFLSTGDANGVILCGLLAVGLGAAGVAALLANTRRRGEERRRD